MAARAIHFKEEVKKLILEIFKKEGISITEDNIKIWGCDKMRMNDVLMGCNYVKHQLNNPILIYTNIVPNLKYLEQNEGVEIFDQERLENLALKYKDYTLYDYLT